MNEKTKVLVVDDSRIFRSLVEKAIAHEDDIEIIGSVRNGVKAIEFLQTARPDVVSLDVEMPDMDGLQTLDAIQQFNAVHPESDDIGVIMLSASTKRGAETTIRALESGAFDFVTKPAGESMEESISILRSQLLLKIRDFASCRNGGRRKSSPVDRRPAARRKPPASTDTRPIAIDAILIGVSTGGPKALASMLPSLCDVNAGPILVVQHMPPTFTRSLANSLDPKCQHTVVEVEDGQTIERGHVYIAPGGRHMLVHRVKGGAVCARLNDHPPENGCRPSVDVLFRSAASVFKNRSIAIILTGMGSDGTKGLRALKRERVYTIAQDEKSCVVWGMPGSAVESGSIDEIRPLDQIPAAVHARTGERRVARYGT